MEAGDYDSQLGERYGDYQGDYEGDFAAERWADEGNYREAEGYGREHNHRESGEYNDGHDTYYEGGYNDPYREDYRDRQDAYGGGYDDEQGTRYAAGSEYGEDYGDRQGSYGGNSREGGYGEGYGESQGEFEAGGRNLHVENGNGFRNSRDTGFSDMAMPGVTPSASAASRRRKVSYKNEL